MSVTKINTMNQRLRDIGRTYLSGSKKRLKQGKKGRSRKTERCVEQVFLQNYLRKYIKTLEESHHSEDGDNVGSQPDDVMPEIQSGRTGSAIRRLVHGNVTPVGIPWEMSHGMGQHTFVFSMRLRNRMRVSECY